MNKIRFLLASLLLLSGCSHYQKGQGAELAFSTLYVAPVRNDSMAPQAQALLSKQLMETLMGDGRVELTSKESADATLEITLSKYSRSISATQEQDASLAQSYTLTLEAHCDLIDNESGTPYFHKRSVSATVNSLAPSEYQGMPFLTNNLAKKIKDLVLNVW
tara:strand:- start:26533 stop:27018 length:486 start_codon:yes stop_codon:yes gene_type:complete